MSETTKHILVIRLSAMGDVAMTVPVLRAFSEQYPDVKLTVLTKPFFKPFFRDLKDVSVFSAEVNSIHKGFLGLYKLARQLNSNNRFIAVADLHNVLRSKVIKYLIACKQIATIDKGRREKKALTNGETFEPLKTTHQRYADVFGELGFPVDLSKPSFPEKGKLKPEFLALIGNENTRIIGIAPFAAHEGKMYPTDLMKQVIEELSKEYSIILFGGGQETQALAHIEEQFKNVKSVAGKLSLDEEMDVISNLDVMLSLDSGNAHIAAMLGVKVITIWGVTHPYAGFAPFNQPTDYALLSDRNQFPKIPTSVYGNKYPEDYKEASRSITPQAIIKKIKEVI